MKRKRPKKITKRTQQRVADLSTEALQKRALERVGSGHFKKAIIDLKVLLERECRPEWLEALADAYAGRAEELARKGMIREALKIWQNRTEICAKPMNDPQCLGLLLAVGDVSGALDWLHEQLPSLIQEKVASSEVRRLCAAHALAGMDELVDAWPQGDQLGKDLPLAQRALSAYANGEDKVLEEVLESIPFRSPFRELKTIFKALAQLHDAPQSVSDILAKIATDSPFYPLALGVNNAVSGDNTANQASNQDLIEFTNTLKGWSVETAVAARDFIHHKVQSTPVKLLRTIHERRRLLGEVVAKQAAVRLVIAGSTDYPGTMEGEYENSFGIPDRFEMCRTTALMMECEQEPLVDILEEWQDALENVDDAQDYAAADRSLVRALILRRMADAAWKHKHRDRAARDSLDYLDRSIAADPEDKEGHLLLIQRYRKMDMLKDARRVASKAESYWLDEPRLLVELAHNSVASGAFKKATLIAKRVLALDPVNVEIKDLLFDAHLAHARKQIRGSKINLADKELQQAAAWANSPHKQGLIEILRGISAFKQAQKQVARQLIAEGCTKLGVLRGRFTLIFEALEFHLKPATLLRSSGISKRPASMQPADMLELVPGIESVLAADASNGFKALEEFLPTLKGAARLEYSENELIRLCELWDRYDLPRKSLLAPFAKAGTRHWPQRPIFQFYVIEARLDPERPPSAQDHWQLTDLLERAKSMGDDRTASLIKRVLDRSYPSRIPYDYDPFDTAEDTDTDTDTDFFGQGKLPFGANLDEVIEKMLSGALPDELEVMRRLLGEQKLRELLQAMFLGGDVPEDLDDEFF